MITESKSEQFIGEINDHNLSEPPSVENEDSNEIPSKNCYSSFGEKLSPNIMTFSVEKNKFGRSKLYQKIEKFKNSSNSSLNDTKDYSELMTNSQGINEILKPKDKPEKLMSLFRNNERIEKKSLASHIGVRDFSISKHTLNKILTEEKKRCILTKVDKSLTPNLQNLIFETFCSHFLFNCFGQSQKTMLMENFNCFSAEKGNTILQEGEFTENIYFLEKGCVMKIKKGKLLTKIEKTNIFGEETILSINAISCTYVAYEDCIVWGIHKSVIAKILLAMNEEKYKENRKFLEPLSFFSSLSETQKDELAFNMMDVSYVKGKTVIDENADAQNFFIIKKGCALVTQQNQFLYYLNEGDSFGDNFFLKSQRNFTVKADSNILNCLCINKKQFRKILGKNSDNMIVNTSIRTMLKKSFFFSKISSIFHEKILKEIRVECFLKEMNIDVCVSQDDIELIFVTDGSAISNDKKTVYGPGQIIGEEIFFEKNTKIPSGIFLTEDSILGFITKNQIEKIIGMKIKEALKKEKKNQKKCNSHFMDQKKKKIEINPAKILIIKEIGEGVSGLVLLVKYEYCYYALKIISKGWIVENKLESYIRNEKKIHDKICFPLITSLVTTWKDDISIYFLLEYIQGKDLFEIVNEKGVLELSETVYLAASLLLTLEYLHMKGIIHRDIKPENIMINQEGFTKVCDLGFGKILISNSERSYTICGTHYYMAPEMIMGKGYSFLIDYWSMGVVLFESFYGRLPFAADVEDPYLICEEIIKKKLIFPKEIRNKNIKNLIQQLLSKSPENRLGDGGVNGLKAHKMFENVEWDAIVDRSFTSPFKMFMNFTMNDSFESNEGKHLTLAQVLENQNIQCLKELTDKLVSDYKDWDNIF